MAVNLAKHKDELLSAWKEVVDDNDGTNWALFGYDKQTYDLCLVGKGAGGLEELTEELNCGKIMYAFCKVQDPNTSISKFILINWQGEGAPLVKKGCCANHFMDISNFFRGAHITITARNEDDVDPSLILDKLSKCTVSSFSLRERSDPTESSKPIGSVYKRIQPAREISTTEREKFWMKEQEEEKKRIEEEKLKAETTRNRLAEEVKERELKDARAREEWFKERSLSIDKMREAEKNAQNSSHNKVNKKLWEQQLQEDIQDEEERKRRSQSLRNQRSEEAQALIAQRTINPKAMFEPTTYSGTYASQAACVENHASAKHTNHGSTASRADACASPHAMQNNREAAVTSPPAEFTYTRNQLQDTESTRSEPEAEQTHNQSWEAGGAVGASVCATEAVDEHSFGLSQAQLATVESSDPGLKARALYDYQAADDTEISFDPDDVITHIEQIDEGWWQGLGPDGTYGLFPANYVELIE
ncbi:drebrin-like protein B isoform X1 [Dermacentor andersoni]|uniref:drebrin-like protein B isoform X1 n=1 Tax=Dermacentor andersoni TaxID=34620 RepID=UPI0021556CBF|nr:drebrin-like protein isoform X1 [Dermacentor andersoni]